MLKSGRARHAGSRSTTVIPLTGQKYGNCFVPEKSVISLPSISTGFQWKDIDISVLTNSDYIMEKMLKNSKVANISGSYLSENKEGTTPGIPLDLGDSKVIFGFII